MATRRTLVQPTERLASSAHRISAEPPRRAAEPVLPNWSFPRISLGFLGSAVFLLVIHSYRLNVGQIAIAIGLVGIVAERGKFRFPIGFGWCAAFFAWALLSTALSAVPDRSWEPLQDFGKVLLIAIVVANALRDASQVSAFFMLWLGCFALWPLRGTLLNAAYGIGEFGRYHWNFIFENPNDLAGIVLLILGLTLAASKAGGRRIRLLAHSGTALLTLVVFLTQSRGAFLGLMVFALLTITTQRRRLRGLLGVGVVAALIAIAAPDSVWQRLGGLKALTSTDTISQADNEGSAKSRYAIWHIALRIAKDNPLTGVGFGSYPDVHWQYARQTPGALRSVVGPKDSHSTYLNALAETGVPGLIALVGFFISVVVFLAKATARLRQRAPGRAEQFKCLLAAWVAFWVAGIFGTYHRIVFPYLFVGFATALAAQYGVLGKVAAPARSAPSRAPATAAPLYRDAGRL